MGILSGMAGATIFGSGRNPVPGSFLVEVQKLVIKNTSNPKKAGAIFLIGEHSVLEFMGTTYVSIEKKVEVDTRKEFKTGDSVSRVIKLSDPMYGKANAKEYMAAVWQAYTVQTLGSPMTYDEAVAYLSTPEGEAKAESMLPGGELEQAVKGLVLRCEAWAASKNDDTEDFTAQKWTAHVVEDDSDTE